MPQHKSGEDILRHFQNHALQYLRLAGLTNAQIEQMILATHPNNPFSHVKREYLASLPEHERQAAIQRLNPDEGYKQIEITSIKDDDDQPLIFRVPKSFRDDQIADAIRREHGTQRGSNMNHSWRPLKPRR